MKWNVNMLKLRKNWRLTALISLAVLALTLINPSPGTVDATVAPPSIMQNLHIDQPVGNSEQLAQLPAGLHVAGVTLVDAAGNRFIAAGINVEAFRDYANGCGWVTDGMYNVRNVMADTLKAWRVNLVRLNFSYRFLAQGDNLNKYLDMAQELANRGIYVMPSDHTYTGGSLVNSGGSYPMMKAIIDGMRARGIYDYLVVGTPNEPGPDVTSAAWLSAMRNYLMFLRAQNGYDGVVVMDGWGWATMTTPNGAIDVATFKQIQAFDATLRANGQANVVMSQHIYPNIKDLPAKIWDAANQIPLIIGEVGIENPGASPYDAAYVRSVVSGYLNAGLANGHNGIVFWILSFCDSNKMIADWSDPAVPYKAPFQLTELGNIAVNSYYSKLPGGNVPPPATVIVQQPTATRTPSPTRSIVPTNTPRPRTATPTPGVIIVTNTPAPSATPLATAVPSATWSGSEVWTIRGKIGGWDVDLVIEKQR